jgi:hypothetical protein
MTHAFAVQIQGFALQSMAMLTIELKNRAFHGIY